MKNSTPASRFKPWASARAILLSLCLLAAGAAPQAALAQCSGDVTPPTAVCQSSISRDLLNNGTVVVTAAELNNGSSDNCSAAANLSFFIENAPASATPPSTTSLSFNSSMLGAHPVVLWVVDEQGNASSCTSTVQISICVQSITCNDLITIQLDANNAGLFTPDDGLEGGPYCSWFGYLVRLDPLSGGAPAAPSIVLGPQHIGMHQYSVTITPSQNSCWGNVNIVGTPCTNDQTPPTTVCNGAITFVLPAPNATAMLFPEDIDAGSADNCTTPANLDLRLERSAGSNNTPPATTNLSLSAAELGTQTIRLWVGDEAGNWNSCWTELTLTLNQPVTHVLEGTVFADTSGDCSLQSGIENGLEGWEVRAAGINTGMLFVAQTDAAGHYQMGVDPAETSYEVSLDAPSNYSGACGTTYTVSFPNPGLSDTVSQDIPVYLESVCPLLFVDLATPKIRPCFPGTYYVQYGNASVLTIPGSYIDVTLDEDLSFQGSTLPATPLGGQQYRFATGDLGPGETGQFSINFFTNCAAPLGATHCTEAHIYPDTLCPASANWSGANIEVSGTCVNKEILLQVKNTGAAPTAQPLDFIVVEDVLMLEAGSFNLNAGETLDLTPIAGNGPTYVLQAEQEPGHPYGGMPTVAVEGCGGFTPGIVTLFAVNDPNPFVAIDCRENVSSNDPNDKQALPRGYTEDHLIGNTTDLDYMIRFQNTGTDTAFRVVVLDTLPAALAGVTVRPGAASHPYRFELLDGHILRFTFDPIQLPDSNVNLAASQGFIQFRVAQAPNNPDGTRIENSAAIYFDFNPPVITNQTYHTVGSNFILVSTDESPSEALPLSIYPNPASERVVFDAKGWSGDPLNFTLHDGSGRLLRETPSVSLPFVFERGPLHAGLYFFHFTDAQGLNLWSGKVLIR